MATHGSTIPTCAGLPTTCTARLRTTFFWLVFQVSDSIPTPFCCRSWCWSWRFSLLTANKISQVEVIVIDTYRPAAVTTATTPAEVADICTPIGLATLFAVFKPTEFQCFRCGFTLTFISNGVISAWACVNTTDTCGVFPVP